MSETVAHYTLLEPIGRGALGPLHRARDGKTGRTVALRLVDPSLVVSADARDRLQLALQRAARLSHPNIASFYDVGEHNGHLFYAQEFVPGALLTTELVDPMNPRRAAGYAAEVADALAELEAADLHHGNVDANAVMITPKGRAKLLLDAGFAAALHAAPQGGSDLAGLGRLLSAMVTGASGSQSIPRELTAVVDRCAQQDYPSAALCAAELRAIVDAYEQRQPPAAVPAVVPSVDAPRRWIWLVVLAVLLGGGAVLWLAIRSS